MKRVSEFFYRWAETLPKCGPRLTIAVASSSQYESEQGRDCGNRRSYESCGRSIQDIRLSRTPDSNSLWRSSGRARNTRNPGSEGRYRQHRAIAISQRSQGTTASKISVVAEALSECSVSARNSILFKKET